MQILHPTDIWPAVRIVNYLPVKQGTRWGPRTIMDIELILIVTGQFAYERGDVDPVMLATGDVLCISPPSPHVFRCLEGPAVISCIHCELTPSGAWAAGDYQLDPQPWLVTPTGDDAALRALFPRGAALYEGYHRYRDALLPTLVREIWLRLAAHWDAAGGAALSERMQAMITFLRANLHRPVSRLDLAEAFALTPQHVNALFRKELGTSPTQFLQRERVLQACRYIQHEGMALADAAARVGFHDVFYFSRICLKITGMRPSQLRLKKG
jgi:AraC-like DNA-binding protein